MRINESPNCNYIRHKLRPTSLMQTYTDQLGIYSLFQNPLHVSIASLHTNTHPHQMQNTISQYQDIKVTSLMILSLQMQGQKERHMYRIDAHNEHTLHHTQLVERFVCNTGYKTHQGHSSRCMLSACWELLNVLNDYSLPWTIDLFVLFTPAHVL